MRKHTIYGFNNMSPLVLYNTRGDMIVKTSLLSCPPLVLNNTRGGHVSKNIFTIMSSPGIVHIVQYQGGT